MSPSAMNDIPEILFLGIFVIPLLLHAVCAPASLSARRAGARGECAKVGA